MRLRGRGFRRSYKGLLLAVVMLGLGACAPASHPGAADVPKASPVIAPTPAPAPAAVQVPAPVPDPEPATRVPAELLTKDGVDYSCRAASDCAIKDVGNCCGYYPGCVNKDSPTFPEQVKANCAKDGMNSICGFPSISGCDCLEGRCAAISGPSNGSSLPLE